MVVFHGFVYVYQRVCLLWNDTLYKKKQTQPLVGYDHRSAYSMCPFWEDVPQEPDMSLLFAVHTPVLASLMFGYLFNYMVSGWVVTPSNRDRIRWDKDHLIYQRFEYVWIVWWGNLEENPIFACKLIQFYIFNSGFVFIHPLGIGLTKPSGT